MKVAERSKLFGSLFSPINFDVKYYKIEDWQVKDNAQSPVVLWSFRWILVDHNNLSYLFFEVCSLSELAIAETPVFFLQYIMEYREILCVSNSHCTLMFIGRGDIIYDVDDGKFFRKKLRTLQGKEKRPSRRGNTKNKTSKRKTFFQDRDRSEGGNAKMETRIPSLTQLDRIAIENSLLLSGTGGGQLYHEQYDEHGVKIEYQCFK